MTLKKLVHPDDYQQDLMLFEKILSGEKEGFLWNKDLLDQMVQLYGPD